MNEVKDLVFCFRARENPDGTWRVHTMSPPTREPWMREYPDFASLPIILKEKIAILQLIGKGDEDVKGVGRRLDSIPPTYWLYTNEDALQNG